MCRAAHACAPWTDCRLKLILTLLAILTGLVGGDAARAVPVAPSAFGAAITLGETPGEVRAAQQVHRPAHHVPLRFTPDRAAPARMVTAVPTHQGIPTYGLRARE
jgi:hypothetical protein